jgi:hypothetical protein
MLTAIGQPETDDLMNSLLYKPLSQPTSSLQRLYWEDEDIYVSFIRVNGIAIAKRQDNGMVNGTKLLNLAVI